MGPRDNKNEIANMWYELCKVRGRSGTENSQNKKHSAPCYLLSLFSYKHSLFPVPQDERF